METHAVLRLHSAGSLTALRRNVEAGRRCSRAELETFFGPRPKDLETVNRRAAFAGLARRAWPAACLVRP